MSVVPPGVRTSLFSSIRQLIFFSLLSEQLSFAQARHLEDSRGLILPLSSDLPFGSACHASEPLPGLPLSLPWVWPSCSQQITEMRPHSPSTAMLPEHSFEQGNTTTPSCASCSPLAKGHGRERRYTFIHSVQLIFTEHLPCARYPFRCRGCSSE